MKLLLSAAILATSLSANAEFFSGADLQKLLKSSNKTEQSLAGGYLIGVFDSTLGTVHCTPKDFSAKNLVDLTLFSMEKGVDKLTTYPADVFVVAGLTLLYPCKKGTEV